MKTSNINSLYFLYQTNFREKFDITSEISHSLGQWVGEACAIKANEDKSEMWKGVKVILIKSGKV